MGKCIQPVVIGVIRKDSKYLLTLRDDPDSEDGSKFKDHWQFPGGGLEFGESLKECLRRELLEEIGTEVKIGPMLPKIFTEVRGGWHGLLVCYLCELVDPEVEIVLNEEASDYAWKTVEEIEPLQQLRWTTEMAKLAEEI